MRAKAVSSAPQNEEPIQMLATSATTPKPVEVVADPVERVGEGVVRGRGEQLPQVLEHALLEVAGSRAPAPR